MKKSKFLALLCVPFLLTGCGTQGTVNPNNGDITAQKGDKGDKGDQGEPGKGVQKIEKTSTDKNVDTYTITYTDGTTSTFTVTNGVDGKPGADGAAGPQGIQGEPGKDGHTPKIEIGQNGHWIIDGTDTGISAGLDIVNQEFTITYHLNGGALPTGATETIKTKWGTTIDLPVLTKKGHEFKGWFTGETANDKQFYSTDAVFKNLDLFARFEVGTYTVTLDLNGGTYDGSTTLNYRYGSDYTLPTNITKSNFEFTGWALEGKIIPNTGVYDYEDITLVAQYQDLYETDTGVLKDHFFNFENAEITGTTQGEAVNHFCGAKSLVFSLDFKNNFAVENIKLGTTFTFNVESDAKKQVEFGLSLSTNNHIGYKLNEVLAISNNEDETKVDASATLQKSETLPDVGDISHYFGMYEVGGIIKLDKGLNTIKITTKDVGINLDYLKIKTSANLVDKTNAHFSATNTPTFTLTKAPTYYERGVAEMKCATNADPSTCVRTYNYLPALSSSKYIKEDIGNESKYYVDIFGTKTLVATTPFYGNFETDAGALKDNLFEFEAAEIDGNSQGCPDHFCGTNTLVYSKDFSNNFCVENTNNNTVFRFKINSDKQVKAEFEITLTDSAAYTPLSNVFAMTNNGYDGMFDVTRETNIDIPNPDVGELSMWFNMVKATGTIDLVKGENVIEIKTKNKGYNMDYFNIITSATLVNNTVPHFNETTLPTFEITKAPTTTTNGEMVATCKTPGCPKSTRTVNYLPALNDKDYIKKADGYYLNIIGQELKVANL